MKNLTSDKIWEWGDDDSNKNGFSLFKGVGGMGGPLLITKYVFHNLLTLVAFAHWLVPSRKGPQLFKIRAQGSISASKTN